MLDSLFIASSGLNAQQTKIDVISNNIANVNTAAYKKSKVNFADILYMQTNVTDVNNNESINKDIIGAGVSASAYEKVFTDGALKKTNAELDIAITGNGFFEIQMADGTNAYTRTGTFKVDQDGFLIDKDGNQLSSMIQVPADYENIIVSNTGVVSVKVPGEEKLLEVGQVELASFINPGSLQPTGNNLYVPTDMSGDPLNGKPGEIGVGLLSQGYIESSNVDYIEELTELVLTQRAYEMNSKMIQASDQILGIINNLYRS